MRLHHKQWSDLALTNHVLERFNMPFPLLPFPVIYNSVVFAVNNFNSKKIVQHLLSMIFTENSNKIVNCLHKCTH